MSTEFWSRNKLFLLFLAAVAAVVIPVILALAWIAELCFYQ